jgi:hypothetical protein
MTWPGNGTKLLSSDGSQVVVGSGLDLSAGQLNAAGPTWPGASSQMVTSDGSTVSVGSGLSLTAGTIALSDVKCTYIASVGDSTVSLLLHMDGANNSTTFTDRSYAAKTVTAFGNAKISTTQSKFGGASAAFDGSGDYLRWDNTTDLAVGSDGGAFTIEGWVYLNAVSYQSIFNKHTSGVASDIGLGINNSTTLVFGLNSTVGGILRTVPTISANAWYHFAVVGNSGVIKIFWNGTQAGADVAYTSVNNNVAYWVLGSENWNSPTAFLNGYIDEFRITKGLARYTSNFTPSASAFSNADGSAELSATPTVGDTVYSNTGIFVCSSASPVVWKKFSANSTIEVPGTGPSVSYRYYRMVIKETRNSLGLPGYAGSAELVRGVQFQELELRSNAVRISYAGSTASSTGTAPGAYQDASKAIDNNSATKWYVYETPTTASPITFKIDFGTARQVNGFRYMTSDVAARDPLRWSFEGSNDNSTWTVLHTQSTNASITTSRTTYTQEFMFTS